MKAIVVYESHWGNTAEIARAVAEGIGDGAVALHTDEATADALQDADLVVGGAPLLGFSLPTDQMIAGLANEKEQPTEGDHPTMREWLEGIAVAGAGECAGFETRIWWSPGSAAKAIVAGFEAKGYAPSRSATEKFQVTGRYGPLKEGERERAKAWGAELAEAAGM